MSEPVAREPKPRLSTKERFERASRVSRLFGGVTLDEFTSLELKLDERFPSVRGHFDELSGIEKMEVWVWFMPRVVELLSISSMRIACELLHIDFNNTADAVPKLQKPPGSFLLSFAELCYSKKNYEVVFCQLIADYREEYFEAAAAGKTIKKVFIVIRHWWAFAKALIKLTPIIGVAYSAIEKYTSE